MHRRTAVEIFKYILEGYLYHWLIHRRSPIHRGDRGDSIEIKGRAKVSVSVGKSWRKWDAVKRSSFVCRGSETHGWPVNFPAEIVIGNSFPGRKLVICRLAGFVGTRSYERDAQKLNGRKGACTRGHRQHTRNRVEPCAQERCVRVRRTNQ